MLGMMKMSVIKINIYINTDGQSDLPKYFFLCNQLLFFYLRTSSSRVTNDMLTP